MRRERETPKPPVHFEDAPSLFDSPVFKQYRKRIEELMAKSKGRGITTAQIHKKFGFALQHLTQDAIEQIDTEIVSVLPTRYRSRTWYARPLAHEINARKWLLTKPNLKLVLPTVHLEALAK